MGEFVRNIFTLGFGNVIAQVISLLAIPIITRLYTPVEYGEFSVYLSLVIVISSVVTLQYDAAVLLPKVNTDANNLYWLSLISAIGISAVLIPIVLWLLYVTGMLHGTAVEEFLWILPLGILVLGIKKAALGMALRNKRYRPMAYAAIGESIADRSLVLILGTLSNIGAVGLIAGRVLGPLVGLYWLKKPNRGGQKLNVSGLRTMAIRYKDFSLFGSWAVLLSSASREIPTLLLAWFFSPSVAGLYALGLRVMSMPMMIVGDAIAKVFRQKAAETFAQQRPLGEDTLRLFGYLLLVGLPPTVFLMVFGPIAFIFVFGEQWAEGGNYVRIMMLAFLALFLHRVLSSLFDILERQRQRLVFDIAMFVARTGGTVLGAFIWGTPVAALLVLVVANLAVFGAAFVYLFSLIGVSGQQVLNKLGMQLFTVLPLTLALLSVKFWLPSTNIGQLIPAALLLITHMLVVALRDPHVRQAIRIRANLS